MERTTDASSSLCVCGKNQHILVRGEWHANHSQMAQHRFVVHSTQTHIWFVNRLRAVCEPFDTLVYMRLNMVYCVEYLVIINTLIVHRHLNSSLFFVVSKWIFKNDWGILINYERIILIEDKKNNFRKSSTLLFELLFLFQVIYDKL